MAKNEGIKLPATRSELEAHGYSWQFSRPCKRCGVNLEFHRTPAGRLAPLEMKITGGVWVFVSHFSTCPFASEFHKKREEELGLAKESPKQGDLFDAK